MILTPAEIQMLLELVQKNQLIFICETLGSKLLLPSEIELLDKFGIKPNDLYDIKNDKILTSFHTGLLTQLAKLSEAKGWTKEQLFQYVNRNPLPLTKREEYVVNSIKQQVLSDIRGLNGRIFQDVNNVLQENNRKNQEEFIKQEQVKGVMNNETLRNIANEIASKTGDWSRNFDRIVEFNSNSAHQEGKGEMLIRQYGDDVLVWKRVYAQACKHCIKLYLTNGFGSVPIIFKLSELRANGTNIGRKVDEWKPVVGSTHPFCRCSLNHYDPNYDWNNATQNFDILKHKHEPLVKRTSKVKITIGNREYVV